jgi:hypothetical protein
MHWQPFLPALLTLSMPNVLKVTGLIMSVSMQTVVQGWAGYSPTARQDLFDAALITAGGGDLGQLEEQLQLALETAG